MINTGKKKKVMLGELGMLQEYGVTVTFIREKVPPRRRYLSRDLKEVRVWSTPLPGWRAFLAKETVSKNPWGWNTVGFPGNQESCMLEQREQREGQNFYCLFRIYYESERILWHYSKYDTKLYVCPSLSLCSSLYLCLSTKACVGVCLCVRHIYIQREGEAQHKVMSATRKNNEELNLGLIYTCVVNFDHLLI